MRFSGFSKAVVAGVSRNPHLFALAAATSPLLIKNDDRGYFKSAALTTPLVGAIFASMPVQSAWEASWDRANDALAAGKFLFEKGRGASYPDLYNFMRSGELDFSSLAGLRDWLDSKAIDYLSDRNAKVPADYSEQAMQMFGRLSQDPSKSSLVTYAVEEARVRSLTAQDLVSDFKPESILRPQDTAKLQETIGRYQDRPDFMRDLFLRLRRADRLTDRGPVAVEAGVRATNMPIALDESAFQQLEAQGRGELSKALRSMPRVEEAQAVAEMVAGQKTGRILGINLKNKGKTLQIPVYDPRRGTVHLGSNYEQLGIGRLVYDSQSIYEPDVYLARNLGENWDVLNKDLERAAYYAGVDPLNEFKFARDLESRSSVLEPWVMKLRSLSAVPTGLDRFGGTGFTSRDFDYTKRRDLFHHVFEKGLYFNGDPTRPVLMTKVGGEGGVSKGVLELSDLDLLSVGGLPDLAKQTPFYRSFSKELQLANVPESMRMLVGTTAVQQILGDTPANEARILLGAVSPDVKAILGDLPGQITDATTDNAIAQLRKYGYSQMDAMKRWSQVGMAVQTTEGGLEAARLLGTLGEGGVLLHPKFKDLHMQSSAIFQVDEAHLAIGAEFDPQTVIGISGLEPVTSSAPSNVVEAIDRLDNGKYAVRVRQQYGIETGAKVEIGGVKGLAHLADSEEEFERLRKLINVAGGNLPEGVEAIAAGQYTQAKLQDPFHALMENAVEMAAQVGRDMPGLPGPGNGALADALKAAGASSSEPASDAQQLARGYLDTIKKQGFIQQGERYLEDAALLRGLSDEQRRARISELTRFTEDFFQNMGALARGNAKGTERALFDAFRQSGGDNLLGFMEQNALSVSFRAWDSTRRNLPHEVSVTFDLLSEMFRLGHVEGLRDVLGRVEHPQGDPAKAVDFLEHVISDDVGKPLGKVFSGDVLARGSNLHDRAGTIFDPNNMAVAENFSIDLGEDFRVRIGGRQTTIRNLPVLGKQAYAGGTNKFGPGEYKATPYEQALKDVADAYGDHDRMTSALDNYFDTAVTTLSGKEGVFRARAVEREALSGFLHTRPHENPFTVSISESMLNRLSDRNPEVYQDLLKGRGKVYATAFRHPISTAPYMEVKVDKTLGANEVGFDESIRGLFAADDDKDTIQLIFHRAQTKAGMEAAAEISSETSMQARSLKRLNLLYGAKEDSRNLTRSLYEKKMKGLGSLVRDGLNANRADKVANRLMGGTIGAYSNMLTKLTLGLEMHPTLAHNTEARETLEKIFWQVRQVPIAAQKGKFEGDPMELYQQLEASLRAPELTNPDDFHAAMTTLARKADIRVPLEQAHIDDLGLERNGRAFGAEVNALEEFMATPKARDWMREFVAKRPVESDHFADFITRGQMSAADAVRAFRNRGNAGVPLQGMAKSGGRRGANTASHALGVINDAWKSASAAVRNAAGPAKPILAAGVGLAAIAGLMTTRIDDDRNIEAAAPRPPSSNRYRPEDTAGETDSIPGSGVAGEGASSNPKRDVAPAPAQTRTAVVAPAKRVRNLDVKASAENRDSIREVERTVERMSSNGGHTSITKNYTGGWRNRASKLRMREQIRSELEQ